jgi:anti-sigma factor RsiW
MIMSCKKHRDLLTAYNDGELSARDREEVAAHLAQCPECRELARNSGRSLEVFKAAARAEPTPEMPPWFAGRIAARAVENAGARRPLAARLALAFGALSLVVGLFGGYLIRPFLAGTERDKDDLTLTISFQSEGMGVLIDRENFILHSRDKKGVSGIDLKL